MSTYKAVLAIDASLSGCSVAVRGDQATMSLCEPMSGGQAERLLPMIDDVLTQAKLQYKDLDSVIVTLGPGAFTGVRIGLSVAKAFGLSLNIPIFGISTLQVLALGCAQAHENKSITVIIETKRSDFYIQRFDAQAMALNPPQALGLAEALSLISQGDALIGDGAARLVRESENKALQSDQGYALTDMSCVLSVFADPSRRAAMFAENLAPLYLRGPDVSAPKPGQRVLAQR